MPDLSVIIVSYNTRDLLRNCLLIAAREHRASRWRPSWSTTPQATAAPPWSRDEFPEAQLLAQTLNSWYCGGNNIGHERGHCRFRAAAQSRYRGRAGSPRHHAAIPVREPGLRSASPRNFAIPTAANPTDLRARPHISRTFAAGLHAYWVSCCRRSSAACKRMPLTPTGTGGATAMSRRSPALVRMMRRVDSPAGRGFAALLP